LRPSFRELPPRVIQQPSRLLGWNFLVQRPTIVGFWLARAAIFLVVDDPGTVRRWVAKYGGHLSRSQRTGVYQLIREYGSTDGGDRENGCGDGKADRLI
jgi:hypothetical protein